MERSGVLPTTSLLIEKILVPVMHFCAYPIGCKVHWRVSRGRGTSVLWVFKVVCGLHCHSFYQIDHITYVIVNICRSKLVSVMSRVPQGSVLDT